MACLQGWLLLAGASDARAAGEYGHPLVQYFSTKDYHEHIQCWSCVQDRSGVLYVGNLNCVLTYDGHEWGAIHIDGQYMRTLVLDSSDRIWVGGVNTLGYLESDANGVRRFVSLRERLPESDRNFGEIFWSYAFSHGIYFITRDRIMRWHEGRFSVERTRGAQPMSCADELLVQVPHESELRAFDGWSWRIVADDQMLKGTLVVAAMPQGDGSTLLCTINNGFYRLAGGRVQSFRTEIDAFLKTERVANCQRLADGTIVLFTRSKGIALLDPAGRLQHYLEAESSGFPSMAGKWAMLDRHGHLWLCLDSGIARLDWPAPLTIVSSSSGALSERVTSLVRHEGRLYAGTNLGLRMLEPAGTSGGTPQSARLVPVPGYHQPVTSLFSTRDTLLVVGRGGVQVLGGREPNTVTLPDLPRLITCGLVPRSDQDVAYIGLGRGIQVLRRKEGKWKSIGLVPGFAASLFALNEAADGAIWGRATADGFYRFIGLSGDLSQPVRIEHYTEWHGPGSRSIAGDPVVYEQGGDLIFMDEDDHARRFDPASGSFKEDPIATTQLRAAGVWRISFPILGVSKLPGGLWALPLSDDPELQFWKGHRIWRTDAAGHRVYLPFAALNAMEPNTDFYEENAGEGKSILWLHGGQVLERAELPAAFARPDAFQTILSEVADEHHHQLPLHPLVPLRLPAKASLRLTAASDLLDGRFLRYCIRLDDGAWSDWDTERRFSLDRLPSGPHTVAVRSLHADGQLGLPAEFAFEVMPPWWMTWWALGLDGWVLLSLIFGFARWRTRRLVRQTERLERLVVERTSALVERTHQLGLAKVELESANATKSEFIASMNHEIRNPMNGILGLTRMLEEGKLEPRERELLRTLEACTEQLRSTMDDVLDFRSLEQGEIKQAEEDFELGALLRGACAAADLTGTRIVLTNPPTDPVFLHGDQGKLRQIVGNYLSNALKYGVPPHAEVKVEVSAETAGRRTVALQVCNHGPTLGEEELGKLFTVFYRGSRAAASGAAGTGLGLAVCRRLAEAMGGSTGATSAKALTTFHLTIPFAVAQGKSSEPMAQLPGILGGRVLVAEDEDYNRMVLGYYLQQLGFEPDWAGKGSDALALAARHDYRLLISDWMLPDMNGGELIRRMRAQLAEKMPPVLVVSAYATSEKREEVLASGAAAFLTKPVDERKLRAVLAEINLGPGPASAPAEPSGDAANEHYDFSSLLVLGEKATVLDQFISQVETVWSEVEARRQDWPAAAELVHRLRSQALLVRALSTAEQLKLLEEALIGQWSEDEVTALLDCARREIRALLQAARRL